MQTSAALLEEQRFVAAIGRSWEAAWAVAKFIHRQGGLTVTVPPVRIRPSFEQGADYGDAADLLIAKHGAEQRWTIEVKWRDIVFTSAQDYPFRTIFVDRAEKADSALPDLYYSVNKAMTHAARITRASKPLWTGPNRYPDRIKGYPVTVYECPVHLVSFVELAA